jgi:hypothetical protein
MIASLSATSSNGLSIITPDKIASEILSYTIMPVLRAPLEVSFNKEPSANFVQSSSHQMKDISLICRDWRQLILPHLFEYACVNVRYINLLTLEIHAFLNFTTKLGLQSVVKSLVICNKIDTIELEKRTTARDLTKIWKMVFDGLNLCRIVIAAPPMTMATLLVLLPPDPREPEQLTLKNTLQYVSLS